jgi:cytochrome P450
MTTEPVEFDPFSDDFFTHPYETYKRMRDEAPVYYSEKYDFYAITRHEDVSAAFKDVETFSSSRGIDLSMVQSGKPAPAQLIIMLDPPDHRRMRSLINRVFTPKAVSRLQPMIEEVVDQYLAPVQKQVAETGEFDVVHDFSALFPVEVITRMLGVPVEMRQQVRLWLDKSLEREPGTIHTSEEGMEAGIASGMMYYDLITSRRENPQDDMISALIAVEVEREEGTGEMTQLDDIEITGFASLLGGAGAETVTKLIGNAAVIFGENPDQWDRMAADRSLVPGAVEELLRYQAPAQYMVRYCMKDTTLHGVTIPEGAAVMVIPGSGNRDERAFPDADRFDIERPRDQAVNLGLGYGIHSCLGAALARMESAIALDRLLDLMPKYDVIHEGCKRVSMTNVAGWKHVPVKVTK